MATVTLSPPTTRRSKALRVASAISLVLLLAVAVMAGWFVWAANSALPQLDGSLKVAGLKAQVTVLRDAQGMPHIRASSMEDAIFAQGYVTAQDRLWQMDITR